LQVEADWWILQSIFKVKFFRLPLKPDHLTNFCAGASLTGRVVVRMPVFGNCLDARLQQNLRAVKRFVCFVKKGVVKLQCLYAGNAHPRIQQRLLNFRS
jgi:hypothetical protein